MAGFSTVVHAQPASVMRQAVSTNINLRAVSSEDLEVMLQAIEQTTPLPAESVPATGTFYSAQHSPISPEPWPPLPGNLNSLPAWPLGNGAYLIADQDFDYDALRQQNEALHTLARAMGLEMDSQDFAGGSYTFDTNGLWLEITNVANGLAYLNLHNATNQVYAIWSTSDLLANWQVETEVWPTNQDVMPFTVPTLERQNLFVRAEDWTGVTENGNTTPDWWFWEYFGTLALSDTNLDSTGTNTLLYDYQNGLDPNVIQFSLQFTNYYVNTLNVPVRLNIVGGAPSYMAVLVNDTNQADAVWLPYTSSNIVAALGSTNGTYGVFVGLRGLPPDATQTWRWSSVTLYSDVPMLTVTNPTTSAVSQSPIQLQGYASHPLDSLSFDVSNAAGIFTNQTGFLTGQFYDTNLLAYTTNYFECSGIVLNSGTNIITLHATDWAGNTANVSFALDYSPDTNPPELNLVWPQDGTTISGSNFTLQAQVSDPTATVTASVNGNTAQGLVEQNGSVWVQNLSLNAGTNAVTLTASNAFGGVSVTHFNVIGNDVGLVINPLTSDQMNQSSVNVTGSINDPSDTVTVNGIQANVDSETGAWEADNVPVSPTGTASLNAQVGDSSNNPLASQTVNQPQPAMVVLAGYSGFINENGSFFASRFWPFLEVHTINWAYDSGGNETDSGYVPNDAGTAENYFDWPDSLPADGPGFASPDLGLAWDYFSVNTPYGDGGNFQRSSKAQVMIVPSGQVQAGTTNVYLVLTCASEYSNPVQDFGGGPGDLPLPPEWLQNNGQTLVNTGITNTDGAVWGASTASGLSGTPVLLKTIATQHYLYNAFSLSNRVFQLVSQCVATTPSNQARTNLGVGELVNLSFIPALPTTNITWSATAGGLNVTSGVTNLFTAPNNATNVTITATVGSMPISFRFKVLEPSYETSVKYGPDDTFPANTIPPTYGAGMSLLITENPTTVSFAKVQMTELAGPASNITGIFTNLDPMSLYHWPSNSVVGVTNSWIKINSLNQWGDHSSFSIQASPVFPGGFDLVIPVRWRVGSNGVENIFPSRLVTARITDTNGSAIDTKLGQEAHNP